MKKRIFALLLLLALLLSTTVYAVEPRATLSAPKLTFSGTSATCSFYHSTGDTSDKINATMRLYRGLTLVDSWTTSGYGYVSLSKTAPAVKGATYQLTVNVSVNDGTPTSTSVSKYYG